MASRVTGPIPATCRKASGAAAHAADTEPKVSTNPWSATPPSWGSSPHAQRASRSVTAGEGTSAADRGWAPAGIALFAWARRGLGTAGCGLTSGRYLVAQHRDVADPNLARAGRQQHGRAAVGNPEDHGVPQPIGRQRKHLTRPRNGRHVLPHQGEDIPWTDTRIRADIHEGDLLETHQRLAPQRVEDGGVHRPTGR